jgi:pimeloyl-ACP methyl ester carboxylesterase
MKPPVRGRFLGPVFPPWCLEDESPSGPDDPAGEEAGDEGTTEPAVLERGVQKDQIERRRTASEVATGVARHHFSSRPEAVEIGTDRVRRLRDALDENRAGGPTRERLAAERTRPGAEIKNPDSGKMRIEPRKKLHPHAVGRGPEHDPPGNGKRASAVTPGDDPDAAGGTESAAGNGSAGRAARHGCIRGPGEVGLSYRKEMENSPMRARLPTLLALLSATLALGACSVSSTSPPPAPNPAAGFTAVFYPPGGIGPFPDDLYFLGSKTGLLNIPVTDPGNYSDPDVAMNTMMGFSTTAPMNAFVTAPVDAASLAGNVDVFEVTTDPEEGYAVTGFVKPLVYGTDYTATVSASDPEMIDITPVTPLAPASSYLVVLTDGITDTSGAHLAPSSAFQSIVNAVGGGPAPSNSVLQAITPIVGSELKVAEAAGIPVSDIALAWTVSTQSITPVLEAAAGEAKPTQITDLTDMGTTAEYIPGSPGLATIYQGLLTIPYYLSAPTAQDPGAPLTQFWHGANGSFLTRLNPTPVATTTLEIPILITVPDSTAGCSSPSSGSGSPTGGYPTIIFEHGIGQNRLDDLAIADSAASICDATAAIDLPLNGVTDPQNPFYMGPYERTFNLPPGLGTPNVGTGIAPSGAYFINLRNLLVSRDNLREGAVDLVTLYDTLNALGDPVVGFAGHSLGGIVGTVFTALETSPFPSVLAMPGGKIAYLLQDSPTFQPVIEQGLEAAGLTPGTSLYANFLRDAQTIIDSGDPANWAAQAAAEHPILMFEIVGDSQTGALPDQVVPNSATNLLATIMGLTQYGTPTESPTPLHGIVRFLAGTHGSFVDPSPSLQAYKDMQVAMASFISSKGTVIQFPDSAIVQQPPS